MPLESLDNKIPMSHIDRVLIILALMFECNPTLATFNLGQYGVLVLLVASLVFSGNHVVLITKYTETFLLFVLWCGLTLLWSLDVSSAITNFAMITKCFVLVLFLTNRKYELQFCLLSYSLINVVDAIILLPNIDLNALFTRGSRGTHVVYGVVWSTNLICTMFAFSLFFLFLLFVFERKRKRKITYLVLMVPLLADILLLGSRQALVLAVGSIAFCYFFNDMKKMSSKKMFGIIFIVALFVCVYFYIMNNEILYQTIGQRIKGSDQESDSYRIALIKKGLDYFCDHPFLGTGLGSYEVLNNYVSAYSHNNYIELLVCTGFVGFLLYHLMVISPVINTYRNRQLTQTSKTVVATLTLMSLFAEMVIVTYQVFQYHFIILLAYIISTNGFMINEQDFREYDK